MKLGISRAAISKNCGFSISRISNWENEVRVFGENKCEKIAEAYKLPLEEVRKIRTDFLKMRSVEIEVKKSLRKRRTSTAVQDISTRPLGNILEKLTGSRSITEVQYHPRKNGDCWITKKHHTF
jgi:transcriptional regulator with XRE-family HTH domain